MLQELIIGLSQVIAVVTLRAAPFAVFTFVAGGRGVITRFLTIGLLALWVGLGTLLGAEVWSSLGIATVTLGYFGLIAVGLHALTKVLDAELSRPLLLLALALVDVYLPSIIVPDSMSLTVQLIGWEIMLSSYSYVLENLRRPRRGQGNVSLRACLFFILVDPTLVYVERGPHRVSSALTLFGLRRVLLGMAALFTHYSIYSVALEHPLLSVISLDQVVGFESYLLFVLYYLVRFLVGYAAHSGLASLQIGFMRLIGYQVPERYDYPFLARGVSDFWRRWNSYVGAWARRYVFTPIALKLRRDVRTLPFRSAQALAVLITFAVLGAAHDLTLFARHSLIFPATLLFVFHALVLIATVAISSVANDVMPRATPGRLILTLASRVMFWHLLVFSLWFAIPTMSGTSMTQPIEEIRRLVVRLDTN